VQQVVAQSGLVTFTIEGEAVRHLAQELQGKPGVDYAGFFGAALRVSGRDREALAKTIAPYHGREGIDVHEEAPSLEDVFIQLQEKAG
jgi:ABC-2 type transport system ATP-binding protein